MFYKLTSFFKDSFIMIIRLLAITTDAFDFEIIFCHEVAQYGYFRAAKRSILTAENAK
jgi:hypothetical protein